MYFNLMITEVTVRWMLNMRKAIVNWCLEDIVIILDCRCGDAIIHCFKGALTQQTFIRTCETPTPVHILYTHAHYTHLTHTHTPPAFGKNCIHTQSVQRQGHYTHTHTFENLTKDRQEILLLWEMVIIVVYGSDDWMIDWLFVPDDLWLIIVN